MGSRFSVDMRRSGELFFVGGGKMARRAIPKTV